VIGLNIILDGDGCWPDLREKKMHEVRLDAVAAMARGTQSGKPTVMCRVNLPDGSVVVAETTLALFLAAADAFRIRHGDPRDPAWTAPQPH
jgi:hypothetical protein